MSTRSLLVVLIVLSALNVLATTWGVFRPDSDRQRRVDLLREAHRLLKETPADTRHEPESSWRPRAARANQLLDEWDELHARRPEWPSAGFPLVRVR